MDKLAHPKKITTLPDKMTFACRAMELLRLKHNEEGQKVKEGKMSLDEFRQFQKDWFDPRNDAVMQDIYEMMLSLKEDKTFDQDIDLNNLVQAEVK